MKLTLLLVAAFSIGVHAAGKAQQVSLSVQNASIKETLMVLGKQIPYRFLYNEEQLKKAGKVTIAVSNKPLLEVLDQVLTQKQLGYKLHNHTITILANTKDQDSNPKIPQEVEVGGTVRDSVDVLPGVSVFVKGAPGKGATTNSNGQYRLRIPADAILVFRSIGYADQEVPVNGQSVIDITLHAIASRLDEVVVVGYGTQKKGDLTGSISSLSADDLTKGGAVNNVAQAIQGRASGVVVTQNSKAPGGSMSIRIRGSNSISSSNEPLYVIDGFPSNNGVNINPDDVESMEILKDASATAIYGSRGANGVVMITTKRGKAGEGSLLYSGYVGSQKAINPYHLLDGKAYMNLANDLYKEISGQEGIENGAYTQSQLNSDVNTDWVKEATQTALVQNHNLQFRGGSEKTKVLASAGYFDQDGILKTTDFKRISGRINLDQTINDYIKAGVTVFGQRENSNYQVYDGNILNSNVLYGVLTYDPTVPLYDAEGNFGRPPGGIGDNPVANLLARQNDVQKDKINGNMYLEIKPMEGLTARFNAGTELLHDQLGTYLSKNSYQGSIDNGVASRSDYNLTHNLLDMYVTYNKDIDKHHFDVMGGYSYEKFINDNKGIDVYGFSTDLYGYNNLGAAATISGVNSYKSENMLISFFGRINYSFDNKYLFTATVRRDGSSRFGADHKWGTFPSGSFAWKVINEPFMQHQQWLTDLKLRLGYGRTGNERIGNYASYGLMSNANYTYDGSTNSSGTYLNSSSPANSTLKWESTDQYNAGVDLAFLNDRVAVTMDAYYKKTNDLLVKLNLPYYTGYSSGQSNVGSVSNKGFEFAVSTKNLTGAFTWDTKLNFAVNHNKVLSLGGESDIFLTSAKPMGTVSEEAYAVIREGEPLGSLFGYQYIGVIQQGETYAAQPNSKAGDLSLRMLMAMVLLILPIVPLSAQLTRNLHTG
ncbi:TonB-dependent receptor [Olivibacter ginsenosidimutans]|uniref:TonB-dependent receptor n=1 Tax=Olivibacter ginsenosidimutans TaxID=1176537 RepID=A0ABP9BZY5_9SPHI